jgi:hypothetical protein
MLPPALGEQSPAPGERPAALIGVRPLAQPTALASIAARAFLIFRGKTTRKRPQKKQHARVKKLCFRLETRFFSSSIRSARGNAGFRW